MKNVTFKALLVLVFIIILFGCKSSSSVTETTSEVKIETKYIDSVRYIDSVIPVERYVDIVRDYDTLTLETRQAKAQCWVDSIWLRGSIENKKVINYKYIDRWHTETNDSIVYKDRVEYKEKTEYVRNPMNKFLFYLVVILSLGMSVLLLKRFYT